MKRLLGVALLTIAGLKWNAMAPSDFGARVLQSDKPVFVLIAPTPAKYFNDLFDGLRQKGAGKFDSFYLERTANPPNTELAASLGITDDNFYWMVFYQGKAIKKAKESDLIMASDCPRIPGTPVCTPEGRINAIADFTTSLPTKPDAALAQIDPKPSSTPAALRWAIAGAGILLLLI